MAFHEVQRNLKKSKKDGGAFPQGITKSEMDKSAWGKKMG